MENWAEALSVDSRANPPRLKVLDMLFDHPPAEQGLEQTLKDRAKGFDASPAGRRR